MGGGPRTFPGGLSKWQYKRMHEKLAREKQRGLLRHEKQLYLARLRSEIRASHLPGSGAASPAAGGAGPTSSRAHIRALADRFLLPGAEDLWNEDDGPLRRPRPPRLPHPQPARSLPSGARMVDWEQADSGAKPPGGGGDWKHWEELNSEEPRAVMRTGNGPRLPAFNPKRGFSQRRDYGTVAPWWWQWSPGAGTLSQRKEASLHFFDPRRCYSVMPPCLLHRGSSGVPMPLGARQLAEVGNGREGTPLAMFNQERLYATAARRFGQKWKPDSSDEDEDEKPKPTAKRDLRLRKFVASRGDESSEDDEAGEASAIRRKWSTAALRNCDMKKERRVQLKTYDEDEDEEPAAKRDLTLRKFVASRGDESSEDDEAGETSSIRRKWSTAALRNCDMKKERRVQLKTYDEENNDIAGRIQELREEIKNREVLGSERRRYESRGESLFTNKRFDEFAISPLTVKALTDAGYVQTTVVQEAALPIVLEGKDVLVKAKTGTGKSVAFLLPAIESVLNAMKSNTNHRVSPVYALVLCPTRELAVQVTAEANVLVKHHHGVGVQSLIGGTRFKADQRMLESDPCQILVATPGRLLDHIENRSSFSVRLMGLKLLVLDEADHLLDLGFRKDIEKIADSLPRQRQTLLFSATVPKEVRRVSQLVLNRDHVFVDTVGLGAAETPTKVQQQYLVVPHELHFHMVHRLLREHIDHEVNYKVIVFCTTAMVTEFMYIMLRDLKLNVREIHSRKPQLYRTRISEEFRDSSRLILVTSDVSTRGVNYPDVTLVIQVGVPPGREHYIHRLGRTGREGKSGKGVLLIAPWEEYFLKELHDLPVEKALVPHIDQEMKQKVDDSIKIVDMSIKEAAYHAWLGYYNSIADVGRDKAMLANLASRFCVSIGMEKPPSLYRKTAIKMGLKDVPGIRIRK